MKVKTISLFISALLLVVLGTGTIAAEGAKKSKKERIHDKIARPADFVKLYDASSKEELIAYGKELYSDRTLAPNGLACNDCHAKARGYKKSFAKPFPHPSRMAKARAGIKRGIYADEGVQMCIVIPMNREPLAWDSKELAAMAAHVIDIDQPTYRDKKGL